MELLNYSLNILILYKSKIVFRVHFHALISKDAKEIESKQDCRRRSVAVDELSGKTIRTKPML